MQALAEITRPSWLMLVVRVSRHMPPQRPTDSKTSSSPRTSSPGTPAFRNFSEEDHNQAKPQDPDRINFDAILVLQRLAENGRLGTNAQDPLSKHMPICFSQGDIIFQTEHRLARMTPGLFRIALEAMYKSLTGVDLMKSWMKEIHNEYTVPENIST
ncbi:hypothetical protein PABG_03216 [Paracoccidioides brasiliensis Pb03]|nr:hypothetical protein PABG_03216 [Paracoccidioides brasiliensis Pb03]